VNPESITAVEALVMENCQVSVEEIAEILNMSQGSAHRVIRDVLQFHKVSAR
jgi:predicted transcriptional regulator